MRELLTFVLGLVSAYLATKWKARKDLESDYDRDLRGSRIKAYLELWKLLEPLAKYSPPGPVTPHVASTLSEQLRHWYFHTGGLFLSAESRSAYFSLQDTLVAALVPSTSADPARPGAAVRPWTDFVAELRSRGSVLRTAMAGDVGTRRDSELREA
jgi:hypothetical protein